jgi:hypothetical protein
MRLVVGWLWRGKSKRGVVVIWEAQFRQRSLQGLRSSSPAVGCTASSLCLCVFFSSSCQVMRALAFWKHLQGSFRWAGVIIWLARLARQLQRGVGGACGLLAERLAYTRQHIGVFPTNA